ncbi:MAG: broad specificity phosphatase PhoE [Paraglaciecola sp.]|jgi:broad specificity phosphatase PhoE
MAYIYLIRYGQASFSKHDYDWLPELGQQQVRQLGTDLNARVYN